MSEQYTESEILSMACPLCGAFIIERQTHFFWHESFDAVQQPVPITRAAYEELRAWAEASVTSIPRERKMNDGELLEAVTNALAGIGDEHDMTARRAIAAEIITLVLTVYPRSDNQ